MRSPNQRFAYLTQYSLCRCGNRSLTKYIVLGSYMAYRVNCINIDHRSLCLPFFFFFLFTVIPLYIIYLYYGL